ncbi:MAG: hypothetical protein IAE79_07320 [Anaerolinea sp.]|nr:hypothetical protein [Anaerolinea sp.]
MNKTELDLANELDAFLTAQLQGRRSWPRPDGAVKAEAQLAVDLLNLAAQMEPDPVFLSDVEAQLARAASQKQSIKRMAERPSPRPTFWQNIMLAVKEGFTMKRTTLALGTLVTIVVVGVFAFFLMRNGATSEPEVVAGVPATAVPTDAPTTTTDDAGQAVDTPVTDTPSTPETHATPAASSLPKLPILGQGGGRGMGGGGGGDGTMPAPVTGESAEVEDMMVDDIFIWNPLADAQYVLNVPFPTEPTFATVYQQPATNLFTLEEIQRYAQLFGMNGPIYTEVFPEPFYDLAEGEVAPDMPQWTPPTFYYVFDGRRQLSFYETNIYYFDQGISQDYTATMMPFAQASPIAEAFLQERGLLDFPYVIQSSAWGSDVEIRRIINGYVSATAEFYISVTEAGQIMSLSYQPFDKLQALGDYPLRSAEDAWQQVLAEGIDYQHSYWMTYPGPNYEMPEMQPYEPAPWEELYRYWQRTFMDGDTIALVSYPLVYLAASGDVAPRIMMDQYLLSGATADLEALAAYAGQPVRIEGIVRGVMPAITIELTGWQPSPNHEWQYMPGTVRLDGEQTVFDADSGETFVIPNAPADVTDGERVNLSGWSIERGEGLYRVFNWSSMDRIINWDEIPVVEEPMPVDPGVDPYKITDVTIDQIDLVYQYSPVFSENQGVTAFMWQPAWRFKGMTNTDEIIEIYVQAVPGEFVESSEQ